MKLSPWIAGLTDHTSLTQKPDGFQTVEEISREIGLSCTRTRDRLRKWTADGWVEKATYKGKFSNVSAYRRTKLFPK